MKPYASLFSLLTTAGLSLAPLSAPPGAIAQVVDQKPAPLSKAPPSQQPVPFYDGLSNYNSPISTLNPLTQRYFNQGLLLSYGFNHAEAARSFREAARLDPNCAMCYWGVALVLGPNINAPMEDNAISPAWEALQTATQLSAKATPRERDLIQALSLRYPKQPIQDRKPHDLAYAKAMRQVAQRYPTDLEVTTLFAEALMDTTPWDYWQDNGQPKPEGVEIIQTLEGVLKQNPNHPGANHLYIHAVEKERPELALASADRLMTLFPNAGHLVHMPSHIYIRTGRYHDAVRANQQAIRADQTFLAQTPAEGIYPLAYLPHNQHFLWFAALMTGQSKVAEEAAQHTAHVDAKLLGEGFLAGAMQHHSLLPLFTQLRFSQWEPILATPAPTYAYPKGIWHYARGMAFLGMEQPSKAAQELQQLRVIAQDSALKDLKFMGNNSSAQILEIASAVLGGELAASQGQYSEAIAQLQQAVKLEDALVYTEPPDWYQPTRQALAGVLLKAGRIAEAEKVYRDDLRIYPENGWSLHGLAQSLAAQGKTQDAQALRKRFQSAWQYADVPLTALR
jgi:tetratricopeptide (TPR) repeat protein